MSRREILAPKNAHAMRRYERDDTSEAPRRVALWHAHARMMRWCACAASSCAGDALMLQQMRRLAGGSERAAGIGTGVRGRT